MFQTCVKGRIQVLTSEMERLAKICLSAGRHYHGNSTCKAESKRTLHHFQPPGADLMPGSEGQDHRVCPYIL